MDQGVLQAAKNRYKRRLLQKIIASQGLDPTQSLTEIVKKQTVKDALYMFADAWEEGSSDSIFKAFRKLRIHPDAEVRSNDSELERENIVNESLMEIANQVGNSEGLSTSDVEDWLNADDELPTSPQLSDEQILASVVGQSSVEDESSDEEDESQDEQTVTNNEAVEYFKMCLTWMERQNNVDAIQLMQLRRMMEFATRTRCSRLKQTDLLQHFRPT